MFKCRSVKTINDKNSTKRWLTEGKNLKDQYRKLKRYVKRKLTWMIPDKNDEKTRRSALNSETPNSVMESMRYWPRGPGNTQETGNWSQGPVK